MKYKITISEIVEKEVPEVKYQDTHKEDDKGKEIWEYVETGKNIIERKEKEIYAQELQDLDIGELSIFINRVR